ncbi:MAG TPA: hypothetical protein QGF35_08080 [Dehalococcoidia bacterium]|nr:hypothetical protein [Dehalococcoidia bacterium]
MVTPPEDEYLHVEGHENEGFFNDNLWFSICDREADVFGVNHIHATNKGYARFSTCLVIDGHPMPWANKAPLTVTGKFDKLTEGNMTYEVVKPLEQIRITLDTPKYGYDILWTGRFPVFDYFDLPNNPFTQIMDGHYEQGLHAVGEFEVRAGPRQGRREINCYAHRDHSWTPRFEEPSPWEYGPVDRLSSLGHFWPSIQTDTMHLNAIGGLNSERWKQMEGLTSRPPGAGFLSNKDGSRPVKDALAEVRLEDDGRTAMSFLYEITLPDGDVVHVRTGRKYAQSVNGLMRGENDAECRMDCYEAFFDFEVKESGERGYGCAEYSIAPPSPRWRY